MVYWVFGKVRALCQLLRIRFERLRSRTRERAFLMMENLVCCVSLFGFVALLMLKLYIVIYNFKEICNKGYHPDHPFLNLSIRLGRESSCQFHFTTLLLVLMGISVQVEERRKGTENVALRLCYIFCILFPTMPALLKYISLLVNFLALFVLSIVYKYVFWCCELSVQFWRKFWHGVNFTWGVAENMQRCW